MRHRIFFAAATAVLLLGGCASAGGPSAAADGAPGGGGDGFVRVVTPFPVLDAEGTPYEHPFLGGFDVPRPQFVDIDADGDLDLFVQERSDALVFFENTGTAEAPNFVWRTDRFRELSIGEWSRFTDLDGDGDLDLLAEEPYSYIRYYRNEGSPEAPRFVLAADSLRDADGEPIFSDRQNLPNVADIDCDGLPDLFLGRVDGTVTRYEAVEGDTAAVPRFRLVTERFENIEIVAQIGTAHGANSMYFADADDDGDQDLLWGDFFEPGVLFIRNRGSCRRPLMRGAPEPLVAGGDTLSTSGFNVPVLVDIDADGDRDLFVGVLGGAFNPNRTAAANFYFLERVEGGDLLLRTRRFLPSVDVGSESVPALTDLDGDGDLDLLVGNKLDPATLDRARLYVFENQGTPTTPRYRLADTLDLAETYHYAPAAGDLDADGDPDLLVGTWNDGVLFYRNEGSAGEPRFVQDTSATIELTRGSNATPALADVDGDGDLDLFVGESSGTLNFYRNTGTPQAPRFELVSDAYGEIDVGRRSHPALLDLDGDDDLDLLVGREGPGAAVFRNDGSPQQPRFVEDTTITVPLLDLGAPAVGDVDGDGDPDIIAGTLSGGLVYLEHRAP